MRIVNERIARQANAEDHCTGRFWEGRFKSQALLDERALLSCMAYVDLNPIRAKMAKTPESSDYTSIKHRISALQKNKPARGCLETFDGIHQNSTGIPFKLDDYVELVDWSGRIIRDDKRGAINTFHSGALSSASVSLPLAAQGQYVRVQLSGNNPLSLAEVEVIGSVLDNSAGSTGDDEEKAESIDILPGLHYYINDHLYTPQQLVDANNQVSWDANYEAFGAVEIGTQAVINNHRFPGQYYDAESGLYYNWNRYYDAGVGRYVTSDPIGLMAGFNTFSYVYQNPLKFEDIEGLCVQFCWESTVEERIPLGFETATWVNSSHNPFFCIYKIFKREKYRNVTKRVKKCYGWQQDGCDGCTFVGYWEEDISNGARGIGPIRYTNYEKIGGRTTVKSRLRECKAWGPNFQGELPTLLP